MVLNGGDLCLNRNVVLCNKKMRRGCLCSLFLSTLVLTLQGCASFYFHKAVFSPPPPRSLTLSDNPIREYWTGIVFNGSKIGFSHFRLASAAEEESRYDIQSEAYFRIRFLMLDKKINLRSFDRVADVTITRFTMDSRRNWRLWTRRFWPMRKASYSRVRHLKSELGSRVER